ncbi:MAG: hypothetical protein ACYTGB_18495, partial [Planctomycetota bacterium]
QVTAVDAARNVVFRSADLGEFLDLSPAELTGFSEARVHFHVPVFCEEIGGLKTTAEITWQAVRAARKKRATDLFAVETYTWPQMPAGSGAPDMSEGIARELERTRQELGS